MSIIKSIECRKLIIDENWSDKLDTYTNYFLFSTCIVSAILCFREITPSLNNSLEYFILISLSAFSLYGLYSKATEKKLKEIKFNIHKEEAKSRILQYGKKYHYRISKISANLIFLNEPTDLYSAGEHEMTTIIFFTNDSILYTLIKEGQKLNLPVLLSQHLVRRDLKKILRQTKENNSRNDESSLFHGL